MERFLLSGIADECGDSLAEQIRMHKALGWDYIEMRYVDGVAVDAMSDAAYDAAVQELVTADVGVSCLASGIGKLVLSGERALPFEKDLDTLQRLLPRAKQAQCSFIRVMGYQRGDLDESAWRAEAADRLRELANMAAAAKVYLALENCVGWHAKSGKNMIDMLDQVNSDYLVCLYDTGNTGVDEAAAWEYYTWVRERIRYIHVKDAASDGKKFVYPGEGVSQVERVLIDQAQRGYQGFVSIEPHMTRSALMPHLDGGEPPVVYAAYGKRLNQLVAAIGEGGTQP